MTISLFTCWSDKIVFFVTAVDSGHISWFWICVTLVFRVLVPAELWLWIKSVWSQASMDFETVWPLCSGFFYQLSYEPNLFEVGQFWSVSLKVCINILPWFDVVLRLPYIPSGVFYVKTVQCVRLIPKFLIPTCKMSFKKHIFNC